MGNVGSKKKQYLKIGSSKYKIISIESSSDITTTAIVSDSKTKEIFLIKKMLINSGSNTIDYLSGTDILSRLPSHPNIVRYIGSSHFVHPQDGSIEFALLTENHSSWLHLEHLMEKKLLSDFKLKLKAFEDICHAIQHCHSHNIAHLSIHPFNILQDGFGTFKISNFDAAIIMNKNNAYNNAYLYNRHSMIVQKQCTVEEEEKESIIDIYIAPELLDPNQNCKSVLDNRLFEKGDIWSLGILLLYLLYDGSVPQWYTNKLGVREADCSMFLGSMVSNFVKTNMIHSNPYKRISIDDVLQFVSVDHDPIQFLSSLQIIQNKQGKRGTVPIHNNKNPIDSMINKILRTNSQIFYNRLMVNFWDNHSNKEVLQLMVERVYMSASIICNRSSLTSIKLLTLLHRLFLQTPQEFMSVSIVEIKFYNQLIEFWAMDSSQDFMKDLVISYAKFMINRLKFHSKNPMFESNFSLSLFMYTNHKNSYISFNCNKWFDDISQSFIDLLSFGGNHCSLINSILSHIGFNHTSDSRIKNILNNCLIPLFEDLHSLYLITTWIIGLLRISFGKKKINNYSDKYKDFMISLIAVCNRIKNTALRVWNCIDIDTQQFPKSVPKVSQIALLDIFPPSSFAPNLSAFNRELVNYFVTDIINQNNSHLQLKRAKTTMDVNQENTTEEHHRSKSIATTQQIQVEVEEEMVVILEADEEEKELSFRPLSRSLSSETNIALSPKGINPYQSADFFKDIIQTLPEFEQGSDEEYYSSTSDDSEHKIDENEKELDELAWEDLVIIERIGIGGFAEVFSATINIKEVSVRDEFDDEEDDTAVTTNKVAIKKLINQNLTQHNLTEFESEVDIMRRIKHPNITRFIGACTKAPHMCIVTELLQMSLFDLLHNTRIKLSMHIETQIAIGATKGVAHLHEHNIIHRDLKSANILLDKHYEPRITDFGLSRMKDTATLTAGTGTFQWMAPEVIQGKKYDEKSDIYSLAIIFWEIKTSLIPFVSYRLNGIQASVAVVTQKKRPKIESIIFKNKTNYNKWKQLIIKMWTQRPALRPNAKDVILSLQEF